ncbi:MAG TPA: hypothetical protein VJ697_14265 [Nitrososphaeraceae archaeon]|nr:hypothetical protein [Nitrososphaeraceae archaeon]
MRIVLTTTTLVAILAIGFVAINTSNNSVNNAFAQEGFQIEDLVNETIDIGNNTATATANATLAYAAEHWSKKGEEYRHMGENIGKEFESIEKGSINENSTTAPMNATLSMSLEGNNTAKPMNAKFPM